MRNEPNLRIERYRDNTHPLFQSPAGKNWGTFVVPGKYGLLRVMSSGRADGETKHNEVWEHVSVSYPTRNPVWEDMDKVKQLFWRDDETVVQFHPRLDVKINQHPYCLHLWKRVDFEFELPPPELVGIT